MTSPITTRRPDALDLSEAIFGFARELNDAAGSIVLAHRNASVTSIDANLDYARDVIQRLSAALDAYEART